MGFHNVSSTDSHNYIMDIEATITARGMASCLECDGAVDADITLNGEHLACVSLAPDACSGLLVSGGGSLHAWIDNVAYILEFARSTLSVDEIIEIDEESDGDKDMVSDRDLDEASNHVFEAVIDGIRDAVRAVAA